MVRVFHRAKLDHKTPSMSSPYLDDRDTGRGLNGVAHSGTTDTYDFENRSYKNICIMSPNGIIRELPADRCSSDNVVAVRETYKIGKDTTFNWGKIFDLCRDEDRELLKSARDYINSKSGNSGSMEVTLYYTIDLEGIEGYPNGIVVGETGYQIIASTNLQQARPYARDIIITQSAFTKPLTERAPNSIALNIEYYIQKDGQAPPVYLPMFLGQWEKVTPIVDPNRDPGIYRTIVSDALTETILSPEGKLVEAPRYAVKFIPLHEFEAHGIVVTPADIINRFGGKNADKKRIDKITNDFEQMLKRENPTNTPPDVLVERIYNTRFGGVSLNEIAAVAVKFTKVVRDIKAPLNEI